MSLIWTDRNKTYVFGLGISLQIGLDGLVLLIKLSQVRNQILDDVGVRQRINARFFGGVGRNTACLIN